MSLRSSEEQASSENEWPMMSSSNKEYDVGSGDGDNFVVGIVDVILLSEFNVGPSCIMMDGSVGVTSGNWVVVYTFTTIRYWESRRLNDC